MFARGFLIVGLWVYLYMIRYISILLFIGLAFWSCEEDRTVTLWGESYSVEGTRSIRFSGWDALKGPIPPEIGELTNLEELSLENNQLSGPIPPEIGNLTNLEILDISHNQLSGPIPPEIGELTNLSTLDLASNNLAGSIPSEIGYLSSLYYMRLDSNQFSGEIPESICDLRMYFSRHVDLSNNLLCPPYPICLDRGYETLDLYYDDWVGEQDTTNCD